MSKTFEVKGNLTEDVRTLLALELGAIQSRAFNNAEAEITVFENRDDVKEVFRKHGLEIIRIIDKNTF